MLGALGASGQHVHGCRLSTDTGNARRRMNVFAAGETLALAASATVTVCYSVGECQGTISDSSVFVSLAVAQSGTKISDSSRCEDIQSAV
jgi:hypothetical protein